MLLRLQESAEARRRLRELEDLAYRDKTTGVANRRALLAELERRSGDAGPLSLLCLDFDGLRVVNNQLSYEHGNDLLRTVAAAIESSLEPGELVTRLHGSGGDEFVIVCPGIDETTAAHRAEQLEQQLQRVELPPPIQALYGGASVGYAVRLPREQPLDLVSRAAALMREHKRRRQTPPAA